MTFYSQGATNETCSLHPNNCNSDSHIQIEIETKRLLKKFINCKHSLVHLNGYQETAETKKIDTERLNALNKLTEKFSEKYHSSLNDLVLDASNLNESALNLSFNQILRQVFHDSVNWGRIVAMFIFVRLMCLKAFELEKKELAEKYIVWTSDFVMKNLTNWICDHNGWNGLVEFSRNPPMDETGEELLWHSVKKIASIAVPLIGVYGAFKFLTNNL